MRVFTLAAVVGCLVLGPLARPAAAVSVDDLVNLSANGLTDDVLVALIRSDGSTFSLSADDVLRLHRRGLGQTVIVAMLATDTRERARGLDAPPTRPESPVVVVQQTVVQNVETGPHSSAVVVAVPVVVVPVPPQPPVYWGFGGQLRPGSWAPPVR